MSGWCRQNTSLHPIPSHYLPAITAVQQVSYRVINTSPRPHTASTSSSRRRLMTAKDRQCILFRDFHASLCSYTFYSGWRMYIYTMRGQQRHVPQTFHLKWYIKATCLKILHMIDVGNDSVFPVWKSYVCSSQNLRSSRKENIQALAQTKGEKKQNNKKKGRKYCQSWAHSKNMHWLKLLDGRETNYQREWIKLIILMCWSSESIREQNTMSHQHKQSLFPANISIQSPIREKATLINHLHMSLKKS